MSAITTMQASLVRAMDGLQNILIRGLGLQLVGLPALVLLAYALSLFTLACGDL